MGFSMQCKKKLVVFTALLGCSGHVLGDDSNESYSKLNIDIGTLQRVYQSPLMAETQSILHTYTFDLAEAADFSGFFLAVGQPFSSNSDLAVFDRHNNLLYAGFTTIGPNLSVTSMSVRGHLPAGENYYFRVTTNHAPDEYSYQFLAASVVPESETFSMFLAGLGLLGWRMRNVRS